MEYVDHLMESLEKIDYKKREKNWKTFFDGFDTQEENNTTVELSIDNLLAYAGPITEPKLRKRRNRRHKTKRNAVEEIQSVSDCKSSTTTSDETAESDVTSEEDVLTLETITEMSTNSYTRTSRRLVARYLKETSSSYTLDECLAVVNYMETTEKTFKGVIIELFNTGDNNLTEEEEDILKDTLADMFYAIRKIVEYKVLDLYIVYLKWLWTRKISKEQRSMLSNRTK